jgi:hypothetical protein
MPSPKHVAEISQSKQSGRRFSTACRTPDNFRADTGVADDFKLFGSGALGA